MLVLEGRVSFIEPFNFSLFSVTGRGIDLDYGDIEYLPWKQTEIKDRNDIDLTEAEDIKQRWQEYTEELYKKDLHNLDNHDDVITYLEPDILECEVKWALGEASVQTKLVGMMEFQSSYFKS